MSAKANKNLTLFDDATTVEHDNQVYSNNTISITIGMSELNWPADRMVDSRCAMTIVVVAWSQLGEELENMISKIVDLKN